MDFIFEEDMDDVGSDIDAYCPKCKADTAHTVISKYEDEVRKVQCSTCGDVHAFRKPRGEVEEEGPEPVAAKKRQVHRKPTWQEAIDKAGNRGVNNARPYSIRDHYREGELVSHPKFGVGFVTEITENKAEVTFQDERRVLVHNRPELAAQMPAIAPVVAPREEKGRGKKGAKGKGAKGAAPEPAPAAKAGKGAKGAAAKAAPPAPTPPAPAAKAGKGAPAAPPPKAAAAKGKDAPKPGKADRAKAAVVKKAASVVTSVVKAVVGAVKGKAKPAPAKKPAPPAKKPAAKGKPAPAAKKKTAGKR
jgi:Zn ribbon nucleic-acid-binding protein